MDFRTDARFFGQQRLYAQSTGLNALITPYYPRIPALGLAAWCFFNPFTSLTGISRLRESPFCSSYSAAISGRIASRLPLGEAVGSHG